MRCATCGQENPAGFSFCGACGTALPSEPPREVRKTVTVLFADVVGSTALGEQADPEAVRATMRRYFSELRPIVERHGGRVEKFIGDAVMAVFGIPRAHEDDALRAVRAAAEMRAAVASLEVDARIGVNTGEVVAGEAETLVTGDAVNVAARLEQSAGPGEVLIGKETFRLVRDAVRAEPLELAVKGKTEAVAAYRLLDVDAAAPAFARRLDSPLVGRQRELDRLRQDFERCAAGRACQLFTLLGAAGVGKSRVAAEFIDGLGGDARVVRGRCLHYGEGITYWPLVEVLRELGVDPQPVLSMPSPADSAIATRKLLEAAASPLPLVVVLDDLQWAEPAFLDLVEHVADLSRNAPIFLLCLAREELLDKRPGWGGGKMNASAVLLEPLDDAEASALVENLVQATPLTEATRARIVEAAEGNPLFVEEMLLMIDETGAGSGDVPVPPTIHALLQARLELLSDDERAVIEPGAVEGKIFHRAPVAALAPPPVRRDVDTHLAALVRKEVVRPETPTIPGDDAFRFRHLLIRDAAYESLPKEIRAELHEKFASWLDAHTQLVERDELVGYHLEQASRFLRDLGRHDSALADRAAERLAAAGRSALGRGDVHAASRLLERAADLTTPGSKQRLAGLPDLIVALGELGRFADVRTRLDELAGGERLEAYATVLRARFLYRTGAGGESVAEPETLAAAAEVFRRIGDRAGLAHVLAVQGLGEFHRARAAPAAAAWREALRHAEAGHNSALVAWLSRSLVGTHAFGPTPVVEAEREIRAALARSRGVDAESAAMRALGRVVAMRGDFETARRLTREGEEAAVTAGFMTRGTKQPSAMVERLAGDLEAAVQVLREGYEQLTALGEQGFASTNASMTAWALCRLGRDEEALEWVGVARRLSASDDMTTIIAADAVEAVILARRGDHERAQRLARHAVDQAETTDFWEIRGEAQEALAEVLSLSGRPDEARAAQEAAIRVYEDKGVVVLAERGRELLATL